MFSPLFVFVRIRSVDAFAKRFRVLTLLVSFLKSFSLSGIISHIIFDMFTAEWIHLFNSLKFLIFFIAQWINSLKDQEISLFDQLFAVIKVAQWIHLLKDQLVFMSFSIFSLTFSHSRC